MQNRQDIVVGTHPGKGLDITTVNKSDLLGILKLNRTKHEEVYEEAVKIFKEEVVETIAKVSRDLKQVSSEIKTAVLDSDFKERFHQAHNPLSKVHFPEEHLEDYDKTIRKLELSIDTQIDLRDDEFNRYVMDNWTWKQSFSINTASYLNKSAKF